MRIAVIGGGINGLCCAWQLSGRGHVVELFERHQIMQATSRASSKLLHGGLRYLEHGEFRLVRESLAERQWWLRHVPNLTRRLPLLYPLYQDSMRSRWKVKAGMFLYDLLAGRKGIGRHRWLTPEKVSRCSPHLKQEGLLGAYLFFDGQMDDYALGLWVADECKKQRVIIHENTEVLSIGIDGQLKTAQRTVQFDQIINVAGPWSEKLLLNSDIQPRQHLKLVRGSHLLLPSISKYGHMLEVPLEQRVVFALPYQRKTLVGTTEVQQSLDEATQCSSEEEHYLLNVFDHYFDVEPKQRQVLERFAGVRPLIASHASATRASREYELHKQGGILTVYGGKWTTSRSLAQKVCQLLESYT